jgi:serine/threonine-protein kinase
VGELTIEPFGDYLLLKWLGTGGSADVHLAVSVGANHELVVIKRLHPDLVSSDEFLRRFRREAELAQLVDSPYVAKVVEFGTLAGQPFIVMEYVAGWTVKRVIERLKSPFRQPMIGSVVDVVSGALEGLAALHEARHPSTKAPLQIVHRDISPKNLMIGEDGRARLIDLGLGRSTHDDWKTKTGYLLGTPGYVAPEQIRSSKVDHRADLYALGLVFFELLTLKRYAEPGTLGFPRPDDTVRERPLDGLGIEPQFVAPSSLRPDVPRALDELLEVALKVDPDQRYQSAKDFLAALKSAVPLGTGPRAIDLVDDLMWAESSERTTAVARLLADATPIATTRVTVPDPTLIRPPMNMSPSVATPLVRRPARPFLGVSLLLVAIVAILFVLARKKEAAIAEPAPPAIRVVPGVHAEKSPGEDPRAEGLQVTTAKSTLSSPRRPATQPPEPKTWRQPTPVEKPPATVSVLLKRTKDLKPRVSRADEDKLQRIEQDLLLENGSSSDERSARIQRIAAELTELERKSGL